jgi:Nif-specific regulatory protein
MENLRRQIARVAESHATVLLNGETGSGKEVVATMLHQLSPRRGGPFVTANCGAIPETLIEAELFGHCRGGFTGATADRKGLFQQADEGTLFLDEIGDLPLEGQVKLLRAIEGKPFRPVGSEKETRADIRFIAATHRDLGKRVAEGEFREDLFFRLSGITLNVPPLREHVEDIPELVEHFLKQIPTRSGRPKVVSPQAMKRLQEFSWPGNVRQLATVLERAVIIGNDGPTIEPHELALAEVGHVDPPLGLHHQDIERWAITKVLEKHAGNLSRAAEEYGIDRGTLRAKINQYKIDTDAKS